MGTPHYMAPEQIGRPLDGRPPGRHLLAGRGVLRDAHRRTAAGPLRAAVEEGADRRAARRVVLRAGAGAGPRFRRASDVKTALDTIRVTPPPRSALYRRSWRIRRRTARPPTPGSSGGRRAVEVARPHSARGLGAGRGDSPDVRWVLQRPDCDRRGTSGDSPDSTVRWALQRPSVAASEAVPPGPPDEVKMALMVWFVSWAMLLPLGISWGPLERGPDRLHSLDSVTVNVLAIRGGVQRDRSVRARASGGVAAAPLGGQTWPARSAPAGRAGLWGCFCLAPLALAPLAKNLPVPTLVAMAVLIVGRPDYLAVPVSSGRSRCADEVRGEC